MKLAKIFIVAMVVVLGFIACGNPNGDNGGGGGSNTTWNDDGSPIGEWVLTEWNGSKDLPFGIYLRLNEDDSFDLYQHTYNVLWVHYSGTFSLKGSTLTGEYSDGTKWAEYSIQYSDSDPKKIKLTRTSDKDSTDVGIYTSTTIPNEIIEDASEAINVRSVAIEKFL